MSTSSGWGDSRQLSWTPFAAALIQKAWRDRIGQLSPEAAARLQRAVADAIAVRASSPLQLIAHLLRAAAPKEEPSTTEAYCECHQLKDSLEAAVQAAAGMRGGSEAEVVACLASALEVQQVQRFGPSSPAPPPPSDDTPPPHAKPAPMQRAPTFKMKASASSPSIRASKSSIALMSQPPPEQQQTWTAIEFLAEHALLAPCAEAMVALGNDILHGCRDDRQSTAGRLIHRMAATVADRLDEVYRAEGHGRFPEHNVLQQLGEGAFGAGSWLQTAVSPGGRRRTIGLPGPSEGSARPTVERLHSRPAGAVFKAQHRATGRVHAIKLIKSPGSDPVQMQRTLKEVARRSTSPASPPVISATPPRRSRCSS